MSSERTLHPGGVQRQEDTAGARGWPYSANPPGSVSCDPRNRRGFGIAMWGGRGQMRKFYRESVVLGSLVPWWSPLPEGSPVAIRAEELMGPQHYWEF